MGTAARKILYDDSADQLRLVELCLQIRPKSLLRMIKQRDLRELVQKCARLETYAPGEQIRESDEVRDLHLVGSGTVALYDLLTGGNRIGEVITGRSLELGAVLSGRPQFKYRWVAQTAVELIVFPVDELMATLDRQPGLIAYLRLVSTEPALQKLSRDLRLFGLDQDATVATIGRLTPFSGPEALTAGTVPGHMIVLKSGDLTIKALIDNNMRQVAAITAGQYTTVPEDAGTLEVTADTSTTGWRLATADWARTVDPATVNAVVRVTDTTTARISALKRTADRTRDAGDRHATVEDSDDDGLTVDDFFAPEGGPARIATRRIPVIKQHDQMDCGAACLAIVARHHGRRIGVATYRSLVHVTRDGSSLLSLKRAAESTGMQALGIMSGLTGLKRIQTPFIALMQYHFVVVFAITDTEVVVSDPAGGVVRYTTDEFRRQFSQNLLALKPAAPFHRYPETPAGFWKYLAILRGHRADLGRVFLLTLMAFTLGLASPILQQFIFDTVLTGGRADLATVMFLAMISLTVLGNAVGWLRSYIVTHMTSALDAKFSALFLNHMYRLPLSYYAVRRVGDFTMRLGELGKIRGFLTAKPIQLTMDVLSIVIYAAVIGLYSLWLLALLIAVLPLIVGFVMFMTPRLTQNRQKLYNSSARTASMLVEHFRAFETVKSLNAGVAARWRWFSGLGESLRLNRSYAYLDGAFTGVAELLKQGLNTGLFLVGVWLFLQDEMTLGQVVAVTSLAGQIVGPAVKLVNEWNEFHQIGVSFGRIDDVLTVNAEDAPPASPPPSAEGTAGRIVFENVTFQYGSEMSPVVLDNVSLEIEPGSTVAFVGASGSGKTTLAYMANRLYAPTRGRVLLDGRDTAAMPLAELRRRIAVVMQENSLFSGTILDNIALGDANPDFERVVRAAKAADAHEFIARTGKGYLTVLGECGAGLSGGQKQRINIARALYSDPAILIMDEATSALDAVSESLVVEGIRELGRRRTTLVIAHRLNTVMQADRIFVFEHGRLVEAGPHKDLMDRQGHYYNMFRLQLNQV